MMEVPQGPVRRPSPGMIPDLELNKANIPTNTIAKLQYLEVAHNDLLEKYEESQYSLSTNKEILANTIQILQAFRSGSEEFSTYKAYAGQTMARLIQENQTLTARLEKEQKAKQVEISRALICDQIRDQQEQSYREIIKEYEQKISSLRSLVQDKERHIQMIEEDQINYEVNDYKGPSKQTVKALESSLTSFKLIQKLKTENDALKRQVAVLENQKAIRNKLAIPLGDLSNIDQQNLQGSTQCSGSAAKNSKKQSVRFEYSPRNVSPVKQVPVQGATTSRKSEASDLEKVIDLYKKEQIKCQLLQKSLRELQKKLEETEANCLNLIDSNKILQDQLKKAKNGLNIRNVIGLKQDNRVPQGQIALSRNNLKEYIQQMHLEFDKVARLLLKKQKYDFAPKPVKYKSMSQSLIPWGLERQQQNPVRNIEGSFVLPAAAIQQAGDQFSMMLQNNLEDHLNSNQNNAEHPASLFHIFQ